MSIEVLAISTYISILLLVGVLRTCCCTCGFSLLSERKRKRVKGSREEKYNEIKSDGSSLVQEDSLTVKKRVTKLGKIYTDEFDEEDEESGYSQRKRGDNEFREEMNKLHRLTEILRNQQEIHNYEKKMILMERERLLKEKSDKDNEIETLKS